MLRVLAGPIVRRVETRLACVWVALNEPCNIALDIYTEVQVAGSLPAPDFSGTGHSIRIQNWLHVAVIAVEPTGAAIFEPERVYSYNLKFTRDAGGAVEDLRSLHLLEDRTTPKPHLALGYGTDLLPSFALPPRQLTDLRMMHASCRRANADVPDAMTWMDDVIKATRTDARKRPHQLFLTGDQIYADDVSAPMLHSLMKACEMPGDAQEFLPTLAGGNGIRALRGDAENFPPRMRFNLTREDARFTSTDGSSHLLTLGEFCAMHVFGWSNEPWPDALPVIGDLYGARTALPPEIWRLHLGLPGNGTSADDLAKQKAAKKPFGASDDFQKGIFTFDLATVNDALKHFREAPNFVKSFDHDIKVMRDFMAGLPRVRRAMANVPVYMIFDDHEVTDDWNFSAIWKDRVYTSPLGRTVLRNGIVSYAVMQGWGNDPKKFAGDGPNKDFLQLIPQLFPEGEGLPPKNATADTIDQMLGLATDPEPKVRWNYSVQSEKHLVVALDVRTRRAFATRIAPPGNLSDKALKDQVPAGPLPPQIEAVVVVSSLTVLGPPVFDAVFAPMAYRVTDLIEHGNSAEIPGMDPDAIEAWPNDEVALEKLLAALAPLGKVVILSGDVHYATSAVMTYWKKRDAAPARIAQFVSSGAKNQFKDVARRAAQSLAFMQKVSQFGASPERLGYNKAAGDLVTVPAGQHLAAALDRRLQANPALLPTLGWPTGAAENAAKPPDWAWRVEAIVDGRPDAQRPEPARAAVLVPETPGADVQANLDGYRRVAVRHAKQLDNLNHARQLMFTANYGSVFFERTDKLSAVQELFAVHPKALDPTKPEVYVRTVISLEVPAGGAPKIG